MLLGNIIKEKRLEMGLKQAELAEGICTQATISNLEKNRTIPPLMILLAIGNRLNINLNELSGYAIEQENPTANIFSQVQSLRKNFKNKEAYDLIKKELSLDKLKTYHKKKQYYFYLGITALTGYNNITDAHYNFNLALSSESDVNLDFFDILTINGIGLAYFLEEEQDKALTYFEKSLSQLETYMSHTNSFQENIEIMKIYYTSAKFYSAIGNYNRALNLCNLGILLQKKEHTNYDLDRLYYEKAFNLFKLGNIKKAEKYFYCAGSLALMSGNEILSEVIKKNMSEFNMNTYPY